MKRSGSRVSKEFRSRVRRRLAPFERLEGGSEVERRAAVLVPLFESDSGLRLLLIRRSRWVGTHRGQIAFPGGGARRSDASLRETALRETEEELGISPSDVELLGRLKEYPAVTRQLVTPFVGFVPPNLRLRPCPTEVDGVLKVPLRFFLETKPRTEWRIRLGRPAEVHFFDYRGESIWGLTAHMILDLIHLLEPELRLVEPPRPLTPEREPE